MIQTKHQRLEKDLSTFKERQQLQKLNQKFLLKNIVNMKNPIYHYID